MKNRRRSDGRSDGLVPIESLPIEEIDTVSELLRAMSRTAFGGRNLVVSRPLPGAGTAAERG